MLSRVAALIAASVIVMTAPVAAQELTNGAFRIRYDGTGITSLR